MKVKKILFLVICIFGLGIAGINAEAEEKVHVIREGTGDLERLEAIEISDEEAEQWKMTESVQNSPVNVSAAANKFLEYGSSDYGYQDMAKRSNSEGRQYAYRQLKKLSKDFTVSGQDAGKVTTSSGKVYSVAANVDLSAYNLTSNEMKEVYVAFRCDNPQFFWLSNSVVYSSRSLTALTYDEYEKGTVRQDAFNEIVGTAQDVYQSKITDTDSYYEKILKIHDTLIKDIEYSKDTTIPISHSIAGAMTSSKSAVCEGYAKVMQVMMNQYGISNIYVTGQADNGTGSGGHAWNMVRMDGGKYYWLDATWDDQQYEQYQHSYFLVGNKSLTSHTADLSTNVGMSFLYDLPQVSEDNYVYDPTQGSDESNVGKIAKIKVKMHGYSEENVKSSDKTAIEGLISDIDTLLVVSGLADSEKAELNQMKACGDKYLSKIREVADQMKQMADAVNGYMEVEIESIKKDAVEQTSAEIDALLGTENLTEAERKALEDLKGKCNQVLKSYEETVEANRNHIEAEIARIKTGMSVYSEDIVVSFDKKTIEGLIDDIDILLKDNGLKESEKTELNQYKMNGEKYLARINYIAEKRQQLISTVNDYTEETIDSVGVAAIERTIGEIGNLLASNNLTDTEAKELSALKSRCETLIENYEETEEANRKYIKAAIAGIREKVDVYSEATVKSSDKAVIDGLINDIQTLSMVNGLEEDEKAELDQLKAVCEKYLGRIAEVADKLNKLTAIVNGYTEDNIKAVGKAAVEQTTDEIDAVQKTENLTDTEKTAMDILKARCENFLKIFEEEEANRKHIEEEIVRITEEMQTYGEDTVKSSDQETIEKLLQDMADLMSGDRLTSDETAILNQLKSDGDKYIARIKEVTGQIAKLTETVNGYLTEKPESLQKEEVRKTSAEIDVLLKTGNLTEEEKTAMNTLKSNCEKLLTDTVKKGDIDKNGKVNLTDLMMCLNHVSKKKLLEGDALIAADIDGKNGVTLSDLMRILNYVSKKTNTL